MLQNIGKGTVPNPYSTTTVTFERFQFSPYMNVFSKHILARNLFKYF